MSCDLVSVTELGLEQYPENDETVTLTVQTPIGIQETFVKHTNTTFDDRRIAAWAFPKNAEDALVDAIAYCPTEEEVKNIIFHGNEAVTRNKLTVKSSTEIKSPNPKKAVWFGGGPASESVNEQMNIYDNPDFVMAFDAPNRPPMGTVDPSLGMNGLLKNFEAPNADRVNLFMGDEDAVFDLLQKFLSFRCKFQDTIIEQTIADMEGKKAQSDLLNLALEVKEKNNVTFASLGIGLRSFCQTWNPDNGEPNFSQLSPHFQTKVVVRSPARLFVAISQFQGTKNKTQTCDVFKEYGHRVMKLKNAFVKEQYANQFVDLDSLYARMVSKRELDGVAKMILEMFHSFG
jgi:hypothetical protein